MSPEHEPLAPAPQATRRWRGGWAALALAAVWVVASRAPLVLNARQHLDSDLAVDGLTLLDAADGHWRWHYPGTPYIGAAPVVLSLPQAWLWGATPATLVSGGAAAALGLLVATFLLAWAAYGRTVALGALVPLTFASTGAVWLSGRITGGHLVAAAWHAGAFALLARASTSGRPRAALGLGLWCGFGLYLDSMFVLTLAGLLPCVGLRWLHDGVPLRGLGRAGLFLAGMAAGLTPRVAGEWADPYNAYQEQFAPVTRPDVLFDHSVMLAGQCLPRLLVGHRFPALRSDPDPEALGLPGTDVATLAEGPGVLAVSVVLIGAGLAFVAMCCVLRATRRWNDAVGRTVSLGLTLSALATVAGFVVNRNIYNSDNYRYLVSLLVPWAVGFGLFVDALSRRGVWGRRAALGLAVAFAVTMTADLARWYHRFHWVDDRFVPVAAPADDPLSDWLASRPEVRWVDGGYWDVYRLAFLSGGRVRGAPFPIYPNRFPEWAPAAGDGRAVVVRPLPPERPFLERVVRSGGKAAVRSRGATLYWLPPG